MLSTVGDSPASRYVSVNTVSNRETQFVYNLLAYFTGTLNTSFTTCSACDDARSSSNQVQCVLPFASVHVVYTKCCVCMFCMHVERCVHNYVYTCIMCNLGEPEQAPH